MPIEDTSHVMRLPRLGKIRLGIKVETGLHRHDGSAKEYPKATDYFVCPPEVQAVFGDQPKELEIMFPVEDPLVFAQQWLRCYSQTQGLICIGNGLTCSMKVDLITGTLANRDTAEWEWREGHTCDQAECPEFQSKRCRRVLNLQFLLPQVKGLGVWQIDSTSRNSMININSMILVIRSLCDGRISMIPLTLCLGPAKVTPPGQKTKMVNVMYIKQDIELQTILDAARRSPLKALMPAPDTVEPPDDLFPEGVLATGEPKGKPATAPPPQTPERKITPAPQDSTADDLRKTFWAEIRAIQSEGNLEDKFLKSRLRLDHTDKLKNQMRGALTDVVPPILDVGMLDQLLTQLKGYLISVKGLPAQQAPPTDAAGQPVEVLDPTETPPMDYEGSQPDGGEEIDF